MTARGSFPRVLLGITNQGKIGLGVAAGLLIVFAILSSFYFPRRNPNFPGARLGVFIAVTVLLFVVTMAGVVVFAAEEEEAAHATETGESPGTTTAPGGETGGDAAAGEAVFVSAVPAAWARDQGRGRKAGTTPGRPAAPSAVIFARKSRRP